MVCSSIGYGGINCVKNLYTFLKRSGFSIVDHVAHKGMDYSDIQDFRDKQDLAHKIVTRDLEYIEKSDVVVVISNRPSYGTAIEMFVAKSSGKKIILLAKEPIPTPWPINFSDYIVKSDGELVRVLRHLQTKYD